MHGTPVIYFKSLSRPFTVLGVDRSLFYLFVAIGLAIAFYAAQPSIGGSVPLIKPSVPVIMQKS